MADTASVIGEFFKRLGAFDAQGVAALFADTIDWYVPGPDKLPWTGHRTRREQVVEFFEVMWPHYHLDESRPKLDKLIIEGESAVAVGTFSHVIKRTNVPFSTPFAMHIEVKHGFIVKLHLHEDTLLVAKAFGV